MGLLRKAVRKSVRKVTPRPVRQVNRVVRHPVSTGVRAVTPRPIRQAERSVFNITHPVNTVENRGLDAVIGPPIRYAPRTSQRSRSRIPARGGGFPAPAPRPATEGQDDHVYDEIRELADRADPASRGRLVTALGHPDPMVRKLAVRGIARLRDPADDELLTAALRDASEDVRLEVARWLETRETLRLREPLQQALEDPNEFVRESAAHSLGEIETADGAAGESRAELRGPEPHAIDESDPADLVLALNVAAHHGEVSATVRELLELLGRKRLTDAALDDLEDLLDDAAVRAHSRLDQLQLDDSVRLTRDHVIPEFELRAHVDSSGPWTMPVHDLLRIFDRSKLTDRARTEITEALEYADLTTDPPIDDIGPDDRITIRRSPE